MKQTYFPHDSNARNDIKLLKVRKDLGLEGYGIYFCLLEMLFSDKNMLCTDDFGLLAYAIQCDEEKLKAVIFNYDLFVIVDKCFYSARLNETIGEIVKKSTKASENAKKRWNNANAMQKLSNSNAIKVNNIKENKIKKDDILLRIESFQKKVNEFKDVSLEDKTAFIDYWTEPNKSGSKLRFEMEKTWDLSRRIKRWVNSSFNKNDKKYPDFWDSEYNKKLANENERSLYYKHLKKLGYKPVYSPTSGTVYRR